MLSTTSQISRTTSRAETCDTINVVATWELNYWTTRWGVTTDELLRAVAQVGTNVRIVQAYLADRRRG